MGYHWTLLFLVKIGTIQDEKHLYKHGRWGWRGAVTLLEYKLLVGRNMFHGLGDSLGVLSDMFWSWILTYGEELD